MLIIPDARERKEEEEEAAQERRRLRRERHERQKQLDREGEVNRSSSAANRKGFMPNAPGGDEPPALRRHYFTQRDRPNVVPGLPARDPTPFAQNTDLDSLRQSGEEAMPTAERSSTPYATHGGEKFNPFEIANVNTADPRKLLYTYEDVTPTY